jgi:hypothetical protein
MTAAKDNETLDHLLSVVNDERNLRDLRRIAKLQDGRSPVARAYMVAPICHGTNSASP